MALVELDFCDVEAMRRLFDERQITDVVHLGAFARRAAEHGESVHT